jgi:hypothetical protein
MMAQLQNPGYTVGRSPAHRAQAAAASDLAAPRREFLIAPPAWAAARLLPLLRDARDAPVLWLLLNICCSSVPCAAALYICGAQSHALGAGYLATTFGLYLQRFLLALHVTEHRPLFHRPGDSKVGAALCLACRHFPTDEDVSYSTSTPRTDGFVSRIAVFNCCVSLLLAPLFGLPSGLYNLHHVLMHHVEGNDAAWDLSSTEPYQRDNVFQFLRCAARVLLNEQSMPQSLLVMHDSQPWNFVPCSAGTGCGMAFLCGWSCRSMLCRKDGFARPAGLSPCHAVAYWCLRLSARHCRLQVVCV